MNDNEAKKDICGKFMDAFEDFGGDPLLVRAGVRSARGSTSGKAVVPKRTDGLSEADIIAQPERGIKNRAA